VARALDGRARRGQDVGDRRLTAKFRRDAADDLEQRLERTHARLVVGELAACLGKLLDDLLAKTTGQHTRWDTADR